MCWLRICSTAPPPEGRVTAEIAADVKDRMRAALDDGARMLLCTCSTLGTCADEMNDPRVVRIDRAMAQRATAQGGRVLVAACVASTLEPTVKLLRESAPETTRNRNPVDGRPVASLSARRTHGLLAKDRRAVARKSPGIRQHRPGSGIHGRRGRPAPRFADPGAVQSANRNGSRGHSVPEFTLARRRRRRNGLGAENR